ncbi:DNA repair protein complementing XP-A cells homolog isoform X1 [Asterias amurensis]|uniref:DNA repair protein complementing XP-A cells homolog isoform X1 n=2 Tax=Asterias amurensis TaxID=7602 RepID=UPI003AB56167
MPNKVTQKSAINTDGFKMADTDDKIKLSDAQRAKIERNRQRALLLRQARLSSRPYPEPKLSTTVRTEKSCSSRVIDTGAGFLLEEDEEEEASKQVAIVHEPGPVLGGDRVVCVECNKGFQDSFIYRTFDYQVCDECKDNEDKHSLIAKTEAKQLYLLKDVDFDRREPILKHLVRKNPHNPRWGEMKLYLKLQVEQRAFEIWGDQDKIEEEKEKRDENKEKAKHKKFDKKVKELRRAVRTSLWTKELGGHEHGYGEETYDEDSDMYSKTCTSCGHCLSYEKM